MLSGAKLTYLPFFIKASALALREHPLLNSSLSHDGNGLIRHGRVHIGVAIATPHGLAVPNIKVGIRTFSFDRVDLINWLVVLNDCCSYCLVVEVE